jgi:hypothetical protein
MTRISLSKYKVHPFKNKCSTLTKKMVPAVGISSQYASMGCGTSLEIS